MKKILIYLFIMLFVTESVYAMNADTFKNILKSAGQDDVNFFYKGKEVGRISKDKFDAVIKSADFYDKLTKAEVAGKVTVILKDSPFTIKAGETFKSTMDITWTDTDGTVLKKITVDFILQTDKGNQVFLVYREMAVYLFPASVLVIIILILILTLK